MAPPHPRIAVIGHVEDVVIARVSALPAAGEILHLAEAEWMPGGGGGIAFFQLANGAGEVHFFTALGNDDAVTRISDRIAATGATLHAAKRDTAQTRDVVLVTPEGERTIIVIGEPLHATIDDDIGWDVLDGCAGAYFTAQDPRVIQRARAAEVLVVTARRKEALDASGVRADAVVGSATDPREASTLADYPVPPKALVMTEGAKGGRIETAAGRYALRRAEGER